MTKLVIGKDRISVLEIDRFVSGTVDAYQCTATFSKDWEGLDREIIFRASPSDDPCAEVYGRVPAICMTMRFAIPSKLFTQPANRFQVTATGSRKGKSGAKVLSIPWASIGRIMEGAVIPPPCPDDDTPMIPEPVLNLAGGEKDEVLMKASADDYDFTWGKIKSLPTVANSYVANAPIGSILFWSGSFDTIPQDWSLCDGQNGTPDLRDKMIIGASGDEQIGSVTSIYKVVDTDIDLTVPTYRLAIIMKISHTSSGGDDGPIESGKDGKSAYELAVEAGFEGTLEEWLESLKGKDAYELAVEAGYTGTRQEFAKVLNDITLIPICANLVITHKDNIPPEGAGSYYFQNVTISAIGKTDIPFKRDFVYLDDSDPTKLRITTLRNLIYDCYYDSDGNIISIEEVEIQTGSGEKGDPGKSAYEIAVEQGFTGTEKEWIESLHGAPGESAYEVAQKEGYQGTLEEWLLSLKGQNGRSAYELAVEQGFNGTLEEWLTSITGVSEERISELLAEKQDNISFSNDFVETDDSVKLSNPVKGILTQTEFDALSDEEKTSGTYIVDTGSSAGIQNSEVYSLEEQVIGRWIDGKPLYRKTFINLTPTTVNSNILDVSYLDIDTCVKTYGILGDTIDIPLYVSSWGYGIFCYRLAGNPDNIRFIPINPLSEHLQKKLSVTIEYTKTTDQATIELPTINQFAYDDIPQSNATETIDVFKQEEVKE